MPRPIRPADDRAARCLRMALEHLKHAQELAKAAGSPRLVAALRRVRGTADGARRHMDHRRRRTTNTPVDFSSYALR